MLILYDKSLIDTFMRKLLNDLISIFAGDHFIILVIDKEKGHSAGRSFFREIHLEGVEGMVL